MWYSLRSSFSQRSLIQPSQFCSASILLFIDSTYINKHDVFESADAWKALTRETVSSTSYCSRWRTTRAIARWSACSNFRLRCSYHAFENQDHLVVADDRQESESDSQSRRWCWQRYERITTSERHWIEHKTYEDIVDITVSYSRSIVHLLMFQISRSWDCHETWYNCRQLVIE